MINILRGNLLNSTGAAAKNKTAKAMAGRLALMWMQPSLVAAKR
jgi:hypothetical protein